MPALTCPLAGASRSLAGQAQQVLTLLRAFERPHALAVRLYVPLSPVVTPP